MLSKEHQITLVYILNLGRIYQKQSDLAKAASLQEKVLNTRVRTLGEEHQETLSTITALARTYWQQNRSEEAITLQEAALKI